MKEITKMDVLSVGKVNALVLAILGFIIGLIFAVIGAGASSLAGGGLMGSGFGIASIILFPIIYGILGFIVGIISAAIYNLVAKWVGGIKIELKD